MAGSPATPRPERELRRQRSAGIVCLLASAILFGLAYTPPLSFPLWLGRLVGRELSLLTALLGLLAAILLFRALPSRAGRALGLTLGLLLLGLGALPFVTALPSFAQPGLRFSPREYVFGVGSPRGIREEHDVAIASDRPELLVDVYRPDQPGPRLSPGVIVIHGGSFHYGDKGDAPQVSRGLAAAGFAVFDLRYRLAPQHPFPAAVQDVLCAVGRLAEPAAQARFAVDGQRIALLGRSAGGTLALAAAYAAAAQAVTPKGRSALPSLRAGCAVIDVAPRAVVGIYPWTDLKAAYEHPPSPDALDTRDRLVGYLGGTPEQLPGPYAHASPLFYAQLAELPRAALPPTLLIHGLGDTLVRPEQSQQLAAALRQAGYAPQTLFIPMAEHGFDHRAGGTGEQLERAAVLRFLSQALSP